MRRTLEANLEYNGAHPCPGCGAHSNWICVRETPVVIRVVCPGECGTYESTYMELRVFPHFDKRVEELAVR